MRTKKTTIWIIISSIALISVCVYFVSSANTSHSNKSVYLSITYDTVDSTVPLTGKMMNFYTYDLKSKELINRAKIPFSSQYALGAVSLRHNKVFYTKREVNERGYPDHLYSYDLSTKESKLLETENRAYNDIVPIGDKLLVSAIHRGNNPAIFDLKNNTFKYLYEKNGYDEEKYMCSPPISFGYNVNTNKFLYVYVDTERSYDPSYGAGEPLYKKPIPHHISLLDSNFNDQKDYTFEDQEVQFATQIDNDKILCVTTEHPCAASKRFAYLLDMQTKKLKELQGLPMPRMKCVFNCYTLDAGKSFYVYGGHVDGRYGIFYYDTVNDVVEDILLDDEKGHVVNFALVKN